MLSTEHRQHEAQKQELPEKFLFLLDCTKKGGSSPPLFALPPHVEALLRGFFLSLRRHLMTPPFVLSAKKLTGQIAP